MTSSYSNIIGTPRDQIPNLSDTNWEDTSPDLAQANNDEITDNQNELKEFLSDLGQIEKQIADDRLQNLKGLEQLLGKAADFKKIWDADKESRETIKKFRELDKETRDKLNNLEDLNELTEIELHEELRKLAINEQTGEVDEQALELLKLKYFKTGDEIDFDGVKEVYNNQAASAFNTNIENNYIYSSATEAQALDITNRATTLILTKFYKDLKLKNIDINSREVQSYVNRHLLPELVKEQQAAISTYKQTTLKRYYQNTERHKENIIIDTIISSSVETQADGSLKKVYNGNFDLAIEKIAKIDGVTKQEATQILLDKLPALKNKLDPGGIQYLLNDVKITHSSGSVITGLDNELADDLLKGNRANVVQLKRLLSEVQQTKDAIVKRINDTYKGKLQDFHKLNGIHLIDSKDGVKKVTEMIADWRAELKDEGIDVDGIKPFAEFFGDETTTVNTDYSINEKAWKGITNHNWSTDWANAATAENSVKPLEGTKDIQIEKAKWWIKNQLDMQRAKTSSFNEEDFIIEKYEEAIEKLAKGDFLPTDNDFSILPTVETVQLDADKYRKNPEEWINNSEFNSVEEKQAVGLFLKWQENNFQGPMPGYFRIVGPANGEYPMQFAIKRMKALKLWDEGRENPEEFVKLDDNELKDIALKSTYTKNLLYLDPTDDDRTAENKVLTLLRKTTPGRKVDHVGVKSGTFRGFEMLGGWLTPGTEIRTVGQMYEWAKSGNFDDFGIYGFTAEELIQAVESGVVDMNDDFDENTQDFLALNLVRVKANQTKGIEGAVTEGYDWRRLVNLSREEKIAVLKFFPNLQGMSANQFQDLQPDISLAILNDVEKKMQTIKTGETITSKEGGLFTREYIQANPEFSFLNKDISEETIIAELEGNKERIVMQIERAFSKSDLIGEFPEGNTSFGFLRSDEENERLIYVRMYFANRIKEGKPVPLEIREALQNTAKYYRGEGSLFNPKGNKWNYKDDFNYWLPEYDKEKFELVRTDDGNYTLIPKDKEK